MRLINTRDIYWLAGFVEGEGSFSIHKPHSLRITIQTTDEDVMLKAAQLLNVRLKGPFNYNKGYKPTWRIQFNGSLAAGWMMIFYKLMGTRRKQQIRKCLAFWKTIPARPWAVGKCGCYAINT